MVAKLEIPFAPMGLVNIEEETLTIAEIRSILYMFCNLSHYSVIRNLETGQLNVCKNVDVASILGRGGEGKAPAAADVGP